jgi:hypothetical protein
VQVRIDPDRRIGSATRDAPCPAVGVVDDAWGPGLRPCERALIIVTWPLTADKEVSIP